MDLLESSYSMDYNQIQWILMLLILTLLMLMLKMKTDKLAGLKNRWWIQLTLTADADTADSTDSTDASVVDADAADANAADANAAESTVLMLMLVMLMLLLLMLMLLKSEKLASWEIGDGVSLPPPLLPTCRQYRLSEPRSIPWGAISANIASYISPIIAGPEIVPIAAVRL